MSATPAEQIQASPEDRLPHLPASREPVTLICHSLICYSFIWYPPNEMPLIPKKDI
ncbi:hypothetical protein TUM17378_36690 [Shewanella algae]|nr:hypothetical protein TUM17378_36690 [Shewanella algae]